MTPCLKSIYVHIATGHRINPGWSNLWEDELPGIQRSYNDIAGEVLFSESGLSQFPICSTGCVPPFRQGAKACSVCVSVCLQFAPVLCHTQGSVLAQHGSGFHPEHIHSSPWIHGFSLTQSSWSSCSAEQEPKLAPGVAALFCWVNWSLLTCQLVKSAGPFWLKAGLCGTFKAWFSY